MKWIELFDRLNEGMFFVLTVLYLYQIVYMIVGLASKHRSHVHAKKHLRYAIMISARNEENVIKELITTLKGQTYPKDHYDIFVLADNSCDSTYQKALSMGVHAYERHDKTKVGKGYALDDLYHRIQKDYGDIYDGYLVFDADNLVDSKFLEEMNNTFVSGEYDALTSYRNSKNFCSNWLTYGYSIWFLHEARLVNAARCKLGTTCMISGTGFLVSSKLMKENGGWPYHLLTEDIEFSVNCALNGKKIGYCDRAIVYDEQPAEWKQSWNQRMRWSKGFFQINGRYSLSMLGGMFTKRNRMGIYDVFMTVAPCTLLTLTMVILGLTLTGYSLLFPRYIAHYVQSEMLKFALSSIALYYGLLFGMGLVTLISEWRMIQAPAWQKLKYLPLFPLFIFTYVPITLIALVRPVKWMAIKHHSVTELQSSTK